MHAIRIETPATLDKLSWVEMPDPGRPGPDDVRVRLHANSLNYHDFAVAKGMIPTVNGRIPMSDGAGLVEEAGARITGLKAGDRVVSCFFPFWHGSTPPHGDFSHVPGDGLDGFACDTIVCPATWFTKAPQGYSHAEASTLPCAALTAWRALVVDGGLKAGDSVLILGTGGVAVFALQFTKMMGATAIITSSSDEKLEKARALGADHTLNYKTNPKWGSLVRDFTGGRGVDHVLEIGGPGTLPQSITAARVGGHISLIGILTGVAGPVPTLQLMAKQIRLQGIIVGSRRHQEDMIRALDANPSIRPVIDRTFPLRNLAEAFHYEEAAQHFGKICVEM